MNCPKCGAEMRGIYHVDDDGDLICDHGVSENICLRRRLAHSEDAGEALADEVTRLTSQLSQRDQEIERLKAQNDVHWKTRRALLAKNKNLADELFDHERVVEMTIAADLRGIERWQEATGKELTHPDKGQLVTWLLEQWDEAQAASGNRDQEIERLKLDLSMQGEENGRILEELNALEARLPKTVDGVPVFGGDELWIPIEGVEVIKYSVHAVGENKMFGGTWHFPSGDMHNNITPNIKHCYSTREAAENA